MEDKLMYLLYLAIQEKASDIHFLLQKERLKVSFRTIQGMRTVEDALFDPAFFHYLKFISDLDLGASSQPQSGQFSREVDGNIIYFRFALITNIDLQTGVLRILNSYCFHKLESLTYQKKSISSFERWMELPSGFVVLCGPTGSGKTTTLHALLHTIALRGNRNVISLEDPIEIYDSAYLQLQINEKAGFSYEQGIRQLLRHDPDVIMIGEIRDTETARMAYRCALTGHMVFTSLHAKNCFEAVKRLEELGLKKEELCHTLAAVSAQRLLPKRGRKERTCVYEILEQKELDSFLETGAVMAEHKTIFQQIEDGIRQGKLDNKEAEAYIDMESI